jgi:hypothetical protein
VRWFHLFQLLPCQDYHDQDQVKFWQERPFYVALNARHPSSQTARLAFSTTPQDAPIVHFDPVPWGRARWYDFWGSRGDEALRVPVYASPPKAGGRARLREYGLLGGGAFSAWVAPGWRFVGRRGFAERGAAVERGR